MSSRDLYLTPGPASPGQHRASERVFFLWIFRKPPDRAKTGLTWRKRPRRLRGRGLLRGREINGCLPNHPRHAIIEQNPEDAEDKAPFQQVRLEFGNIPPEAADLGSGARLLPPMRSGSSIEEGGQLSGWNPAPVLVTDSLASGPGWTLRDCDTTPDSPSPWEKSFVSLSNSSFCHSSSSAGKSGRESKCFLMLSTSGSASASATRASRCLSGIRDRSRSTCHSSKKPERGPFSPCLS